MVMVLFGSILSKAKPGQRLGVFYLSRATGRIFGYDMGQFGAGKCAGPDLNRRIPTGQRPKRCSGSVFRELGLDDCPSLNLTVLELFGDRVDVFEIVVGRM